mmetsp:Transcript_15941/g.64286  ORF Transcript_15941/g.64286 Transcript_15941/m.64286 type:complete len:265 (-) Transcript_15941:1054-1848(-)
MGATLGTAAMPPSGARTGGAREVASPSGSWSDGSECSPRDRSPRWGPPEAASSDDGSPVYNNLGGVTTDDSTSDASASNASGAPHPESEASSSSRPPRDAPTPNRPMQHAARPARAPARARRHVVKHRVLKSLAVCGRLSARPAGPGAPEPREPAEPMDLDLYDDDDDAGDDDDDQRSPSRARRLVRPSRQQLRHELSPRDHQDKHVQGPPQRSIAAGQRQRSRVFTEPSGWRWSRRRRRWRRCVSTLERPCRGLKGRCSHHSG